MDSYKIDYEKYEMIEKDDRIEINPNQIQRIFGILLFCAVYTSISFALHFCKKSDEVLKSFFDEINWICLNSIKKGYASVSIELYDYLLKISEKSSDKFMYTINKCVGLKKCGKAEDLQALLDTLDWSNCDEDFKFAKSCLLDKEKDAIEFLKKQEDKEKWKYCLQTWPLCELLIKSDTFIAEYPKIFGEPFEMKIIAWKNTKEDLKRIEKDIEKAVKCAKEEKRSENKDEATI